MKYIKASNLPPRLNLLWPLTTWLVLERFGAPGWLYGAVYLLYGISALGELYRLFTGTAVDMLAGKAP